MVLQIIPIVVIESTQYNVSDCISSGREFDPGPVPYFRGG